MPRYFTCSSVRVEARERCLSPSLTSRPDRWQICGLARLGREERLRSLRDHCRAVVVGCQHHGTLTVRYAAHPSWLRADRRAKIFALSFFDRFVLRPGPCIELRTTMSAQQGRMSSAGPRAVVGPAPLFATRGSVSVRHERSRRPLKPDAFLRQPR